MEILIWDPEHRKLDFKMTTQWMVTNILWKFIRPSRKRNRLVRRLRKKFRFPISEESRNLLVDLRFLPFDFRFSILKIWFRFPRGQFHFWSWTHKMRFSQILTVNYWRQTRDNSCAMDHMEVFIIFETKKKYLLRF